MGKGAESRGGRRAERGEEGEKREEGGMTSFSFSHSSSLPSLSSRLISSISVSVTPTTLIVESFASIFSFMEGVEQEGCQDLELVHVRVMTRISPTFSFALQVVHPEIRPWERSETYSMEVSVGGMVE